MNKTEVFQALTQVIRDLIAVKAVLGDIPGQAYLVPIVLALDEAIDSLQEIRLYI